MPFESENNCKEWESKFINYFSTLNGFNGVFLSYVMRGKENRDENGELPDFINKKIVCAILKGIYYEPGIHTLQQELVSFTTGKAS